MTWTPEEDQAFERDWWQDCANTFGEEAKQLTYANKMGLVVVQDGTGHWPVYDMEGKSILDLGGGPVSMLLKCRNFDRAMVVDPCEYPDWIEERYAAHGVSYARMNAEDFPGAGDDFDEAWFYNVLQHTENAAGIVEVARKYAKRVRCFEWIDTERTLGHPTVLTERDLNEWLDTRGNIEFLEGENGCYGMCYTALTP
jgi:2-polyprenyl-3-methyl-5-hydroxy-6-metoxy-1,4-benzoquinol methylase